MPNKQNILFFFTDDQRFNTINALGNDQIKTPNLDKLVENGTCFTHAHIPGGTSGAVCMPSRAMLHTGRTLFNITDEGQTISDDHTTIGEAFRNSGYNTFGTGKWHNGRKSYARSFTHGGEIFFGGMWDHWNIPAYNFDPTGEYNKKSRVINNPFYDNKVTYNYCDHMTFGKHSSELFCDTAIDFINNYDSDRPYFMYISFMAPHDPRSMPDEYLNMYDPANIELPENYMEKFVVDYGQMMERDELLASYPRDEKEVKRHIAEYYGMISHLDNELGRVLDALDASGQRDNTIIVFAGDNGLSLGQHGHMGKQCLYEHSIRVPLIFAGPNIPKGEKRDNYAFLLDIYPTLCDMANIEPPKSVEGISLFPVIKDETQTTRDILYLAFTNKIRAIKDNRFKLIEYRTEDMKQTQLFDIDKDPLELNNLASNKDYQDTVNRLQQLMLNLSIESNDTNHRLGKQYWSNY